MESDKNLVDFAGIIYRLIIVATMWYLGYSIGVESVKREAVLKGFAEYKSSESGKAAWQWKSVTPVGPEVVE
jgi:hypothetical protein